MFTNHTPKYPWVLAGIASWFVMMLLLSMPQQVIAQTYGAVGYPVPKLLNVEINGCSCNLEEIGLLETSSGVAVYPEGDLAICPDGSMFIFEHDSLYEVDPATGLCTYLPVTPPFPTTPLYGMGGLACGENGNLYAVTEPFSGSSLFSINPNSQMVDYLGDLPWGANHGMFFNNGNLYMAADGGMVIVDTLNPPASDMIFEFPFAFNVTGATNTYCGYEAIVLEQNMVMYSLDLIDGSLFPICTTAYHWMSMATVPGGGIGDCDVQLDLDCDDSSGADGIDFNSPDFNCLVESVPIADVDCLASSDTTIETMTVTITPGTIEDDPDEFLDVTGPTGSFDIDGIGTSELIINNPSGASNAAFRQLLQDIVYVNAASPLTPGGRTIEVSFTDHSGNNSDVAIAYIEVEQLDSVSVDLGPDATLCEGETLLLDATYPGASYLWSTGAITPTILVDQSGGYTVVVTHPTLCQRIEEIELTVLPVAEIILAGDSSTCEDEPAFIFLTNNTNVEVNIDIDIIPGTDFINVTDFTGTETFTYDIVEETEFVIISAIPSGEGCIDLLDSVQIVQLFPNYHIDIDTVLCDGDSIWLGTYWETDPGVYGTTYQTINGCDSIISYHITIADGELIQIHLDTCDEAAAGIIETVLPNPNGCDTVVQTIITYLAPDSTLLTSTTCAQQQAGVFTQTLPNTHGCDSLIITTVEYVPPADTTAVSQFTCDENSAGTVLQLFVAADGCDSLVALTSVYLEPDTTLLFGTSCIPAEIGAFTSTHINASGCDSVIISTITPGTGDTTFVAETSCDSASLGIHELLLTGSSGCDSLVITTITYEAIDSTLLFAQTCTPGEEGIYINQYIDQFGCDSVVIETITLQPSHAFTIHQSSCNPADTGTVVQYLFNQFGCDSIVTTITSHLPFHALFLEEQTCIAADTGTTVQYLVNQYGCDSIVTTHTSFTLVDTTSLFLTTCDPDAAGTTQTWLVTAEGCDSLVITTTTFTAIAVAIQVTTDYHGHPISCADASDGGIVANATGASPFGFTWSTSDTGPALNEIPAGNYSVTVIDDNGCSTTSAIELVAPPELSMQFIVNEPGCFDDETGFITAVPEGGVTPYEFSLDGTSFQKDPTFNQLGPGTYQVTAEDANECRITETVWINQLLRVHVTLGEDIDLLYGDSTLVEAVVNIPEDSLVAIHWTGAFTQQCPTCLTQQVAPLMTTSYFIEVESVDGCADADTMTVHVIRDTTIYIPNAFSPNGDGINDVLQFYTGSEIVNIERFAIYDRWGSRMFMANSRNPTDPGLFWDGTYKGRPCNPGVFVYLMVATLADNRTVVRRGDVTLLR